MAWVKVISELIPELVSSVISMKVICAEMGYAARANGAMKERCFFMAESIWWVKQGSGFEIKKPGQKFLTGFWEE
jgi:hypothetical protein